MGDWKGKDVLALDQLHQLASVEAIWGRSDYQARAFWHSVSGEPTSTLVAQPKEVD